MWAMKILKYIGKVIFRILLVPVILLVAALSIFVKILVHVGAFAVGLFLLFLLLLHNPLLSVFNNTLLF